MSAAIDEDGGGGEHVEEPLGENGEFEVLLELAEEKQQHGGEQPLDDERSGGGLEARMNVRELAEEEAVTRGGEGNARTGHDGSVEGDEDAEGHGGGDESCAARAGDDGKRCDGGTFAGGDLRGGQDVLNGRVGGHEENADDEESADERDGQAALGAADFAGDHGEIVPSVVGPERGDEREHESAEAAACVRAATVAKLRQEPDAEAKQSAATMRMSMRFEDGEDELEVAGLFDAEIVQSSDEPGDAMAKICDQSSGVPATWSVRK